MPVLAVEDGSVAVGIGCLGLGLVWYWFFNSWLRHRLALLEQRTQDLALITSCGGLLFNLTAFALVSLHVDRWAVYLPLAGWLTFVTAYAARRTW